MHLFLKISLFLVCVTSNGFYAQNGILGNYDFRNGDISQITLGSELNEISGLAFSNGKLFCHNDEFATIYEIDIFTGKVIKKFFAGTPVLEGDFEDLVILDNKFYLVASNGTVYVFEEGKNNESVSYKKIKTRLKSKNDVEGIQYSPEKDKLLLTCKESAGRKYRGYRAVYELDLSSGEVEKEPKFLLNIKKIKRKTRRRNFNPSAIKLTDQNTYLILDGKGKSLIEINQKGKLLNAVSLSKSRHNQPEGIEILNDKTIVISDEAGNDEPGLTFYRAGK
ncbi:MAG: hypothetical protein ACEPO8_06240 [Rhodothermaceae bacterium]